MNADPIEEVEDDGINLILCDEHGVPMKQYEPAELTRHEWEAFNAHAAEQGLTWEALLLRLLTNAAERLEVGA